MANVNFHNVSKEEQALKLAKEDLIAFGKLFLPDDYMRSETPFFHYEVSDALNDLNARQLAVILPRGHGKTVLTKCSIMHDFMFATKDNPLFYGWVAASSKISVPNLDYIKYHIEYNDKIRYYFGDLKGRKWTEDDIELKNGCKLISKSNLSGIRGGAKLHKRYDLIVLDDFEDENNTITPESRSKISNLVTAVVFPALEPKTGRLRINGTPVHYDAFIQKILVGYEKAQKEKEPYSWKVITYKAVQNDGTPLWPDWFGKEEMERKKKFYADSGTPQKFYQEYMMEVQSEEDSIFTREHIKYWEGEFIYDQEADIASVVTSDGDGKPGNVFAGGDPATDSIRRDADYSVILIIGCDADNNIYVLDYFRRRSLPVLGIPGSDRKGIVDHIFRLNKIYRPSLFTIEDTTMSKPVFQAIRAEMMRQNDFSVNFKEEKPGTRMSKRDRIQEILAQRFSVGQIHIKKTQYDLQREIITFGPRMAHDDTIDSLAYACKFAHPCMLGQDKDGNWFKKKPKAKSWVTA